MAVRKDRHTPEQRSYNMSRIRSTNTQLELKFFQLMSDEGIAFVAHPKIYGKPDCIIQTNILIFVDSDFWHGWHFKQWRERMPKKYWVEKIERNIHRDKQKFRKLRAQGYIVIRIWEHTLLKNPAKALQLIRKSMN